MIVKKSGKCPERTQIRKETARKLDAVESKNHFRVLNADRRLGSELSSDARRRAARVPTQAGNPKSKLLIKQRAPKKKARNSLLGLGESNAQLRAAN